MSEQANVDAIIIRMITKAMDRFVGACMDETGAPKSPTKKDIIEARKMLPGYCEHTLIKSSK